ncbi:MAG: neutral/alkaline non-lysosomal ceramidase N-terminal domain-containing protein [Deltaproteobacteria bacterium]|nr:neutral/alkaline non-lysosomal ceramidase N-terminal domain-containing protein [Deltaproteobacteria bacterium]
MYIYLRSLLTLVVCVFSICRLSIQKNTIAADLLDNQGLKPFLIGSAINDITGTVMDRPIMAYGLNKQTSNGIHSRLWARAFVIENPHTNQTIAIVSTDLGLMFDSIKTEVLFRLNQKLPGVFTDANVMISATHTHAAPGGYSFHDFFNFSTKGFDFKNWAVISVDIYNAIYKAYLSRKPGNLFLNEGELNGASQNRSLSAYNANLDIRTFETTTDTTNLTLRFQQENAELKSEIGIINWFAVHPTCLNNKNHLISGDSKGAASELFEREMGYAYLKANSFIAAFINSNEGDVSPMFKTDRSGNRINAHSGNRINADDFQLLEKSAMSQFQKAKELFETSSKKLEPTRLDCKLAWVNMSKLLLTPEFGLGKTRSLCQAAVGYSFAAGAEDGPSGVPGISEGIKKGDFIFPALEAFASLIRLLLHGSTIGEECQNPKLVLISNAKDKTDLLPETIPMQLFIIGSLAIAGVPGEFTTMAGRRLKSLLLEELSPLGVKTVTISAIANDYSGYVTTFEEYQEQQYEGGFTLYGPYTHQAYLQTFKQLANSIAKNNILFIHEKRKTRDSELKDFLTDWLDGKNTWEKFGTVLKQPQKKYETGNTVEITFRSANPNNSTGILDNYVAIQVLKNNIWVSMTYDWNSETKLVWFSREINRDRESDNNNLTNLKVFWKIPPNTTPGIYRIKHFGHWRVRIDEDPVSFEGATEEFFVK